MDGDYYEQVAGKTLPCLWCAEKIKKGEQHQHYYGDWDGERQNWRMHNECRDAFLRETDGEGGTIKRHSRNRGMTEDEMRKAKASS